MIRYYCLIYNEFLYISILRYIRGLVTCNYHYLFYFFHRFGFFFFLQQTYIYETIRIQNYFGETVLTRCSTSNIIQYVFIYKYIFCRFYCRLLEHLVNYVSRPTTHFSSVVSFYQETPHQHPRTSFREINTHVCLQYIHIHVYMYICTHPMYKL